MSRKCSCGADPTASFTFWFTAKEGSRATYPRTLKTLYSCDTCTAKGLRHVSADILKLADTLDDPQEKSS